jgi:hypothetical protein
MFGRKQAPQNEPTVEPGSGDADPQGAKGRPTPSRREAEAARKQQLKIPKDPKEAKKAARERDRDDRSKQRAAMMSGDERFLPARDKGPAKAFTRDFVDSRFTMGVLALGFVRNAAVQSFVSIAFFAVTALIAFDTIVLLIQLNRRATKEFPDKADRKGITLYAALRTLQLRRLRLPPPRVKRGGAPKLPKA